VSFKRKQTDKQKVNNFVAKHDFNIGGYHGKSNKQQRTNQKLDLNNVDLNDPYIWEELEEEYDNE
jgi:hypothetical protein